MPSAKRCVRHSLLAGRINRLLVPVGNRSSRIGRLSSDPFKSPSVATPGPGAPARPSVDCQVFDVCRYPIHRCHHLISRLFRHDTQQSAFVRTILAVDGPLGLG